MVFFLKFKNITKLCHKNIEISLKKRNFLFFGARALKINRKLAINIVEIEFKFQLAQGTRKKVTFFNGEILVIFQDFGQF